LLVTISALSVAALSSTYRLREDTLGGIGRMANDTYVLDSALGQVAPGSSSNNTCSSPSSSPSPAPTS
jgi:hypothetical protein